MTPDNDISSTSSDDTGLADIVDATTDQRLDTKAPAKVSFHDERTAKGSSGGNNMSESRRNTTEDPLGPGRYRDRATRPGASLHSTFQPFTLVGAKCKPVDLLSLVMPVILTVLFVFCDVIPEPQHLALRITSLCLRALAYLRMRRFTQHGELSDLEDAIAFEIRAMHLTPASHASKLIQLETLGHLHLKRFERLGELSDINQAIDFLTLAVWRTPDGHPDKPKLLNHIGVIYICRLEHLGEQSDLEGAIACQLQAVQLAPDHHADKPEYLSVLGMSHLRRFDRFGELSDIDKAVSYQRQAVEQTLDNSPAKPLMLHRLGLLYVCRFKSLAELSDIDEAVTCQSQAVQLTSDGHPVKQEFLRDLGKAHRHRFNRLGDVTDINEAVACISLALQLTPDEPALLNELGLSYVDRFRRLGQSQDLEKGTAMHLQAIEHTPDNHVEKPIFLHNLGVLYFRRFDFLGEVSELDKAIACQDLAVLLATDGCENNPLILNYLGGLYMRRSQILGDLSDADKGISYQILAMQLIPDDHVDRALFLNDLGCNHLHLFESLGDLSYLDKAISYQDQATQIAPDHDTEKPVFLNNLGVSLMYRFALLGDPSDAEKAVKCQAQAMQLTPDGHGNKPWIVHYLGWSMGHLLEVTGNFTHISIAICCQSQILRLTPDGHIGKPTMIGTLGHLFSLRFQSRGEPLDIDQAVASQIQALQLIPDGHASKAIIQYQLGNSYMLRFRCVGERLDLESATNVFKEAGLSSSGPPAVRFKAAHEWARSCALLGTSPEAAYQRTMTVISQLVWVGTTIDRRYSALSRIGDVAMEAAAFAISDAAPERALEWLEGGRSIVWKQILQLRAPYEDLSAVDQVLSKRLKRVGNELEHAGSRSNSKPLPAGPGTELELIAQSHRRLATEWDQLLEQARSLPGLQDFLRPPKSEALIRAAKDGPIILVNAHSSRCDALIILPNAIKIAHVPLPDFSYEKAVDARAQLRNLTGQRNARAGGFRRRHPESNHEYMYKQLLTVLWVDVVRPILEFLGYTKALSVNQLPHVTWCTTGALSFLPLHAAGCYDGLQPNAFDLVVSSYTPTLSALLASDIPTANASSGILAVGQKDTKGLSALPNTVQELAIIEEHAKDISKLRLDGENATVDAVLNAMEEYSWVHLACHASQNAADPSQSAFHLHDGSLMLSAITKRSFKNKGLAFLSACQTATGDEKLPDEAVHLAAGMLMAGYPSVIATMWGIADVAQEVYADLLKDGKMDCTGASRALHKAVAGLRKIVGEESFERWVPFIHIGQ